MFGKKKKATAAKALHLENPDYTHIVSVEGLVHDFIDTDEEGKETERLRAVNNVSLDVNEGEFIAILGHNGSGKSTLAKHINAILMPTEGTVYVGGMDTKDNSKLWNIRQQAGMVFQNPDNQIIATIVEEDVGFGPENLGVPTEDIWVRVEKALNDVGMIEYRHHSPTKLSGGQKQRVAIAGVMAMKPKCIVLDEPTAMLDPNGRKEVLSTLKELNRQEKVTIILITHYMDEVIDADRVFVMDDGNIALEGTPREVFSNVEKIKSLGLDVPQVTEIAYKLKKKGVDFQDGVLTIEEFVEQLERCRQSGGKKAEGVAENRGSEAENKAKDKADIENMAENLTISREDKAETEVKTEAMEEETIEEKAIEDKEIVEKIGTSVKERVIEEGKKEVVAKAENRIEAVNQEKSVAKCTGNEKKYNQEVIMTLEHVNYTYSADTAFRIHALKDINLKLYEGQFIGVIGHTGSGKSTLIQHLDGLIRAESGRLLFRDKNIYDDDFVMPDLRKKVGLVFQYPEYQLFEATVLEDVMFGPKNLGKSEEEAKQTAMEALKAVGADESLWEKSPFELSGGQKRRVAIAGVLAMETEVLILDEPTAALDPKGRDEILGLIDRLHRERKITIILVSHSMEDVAKHADRIIVMNKGQVAYDGTPEEVFAYYKELEEIGLAAPQVTYLVAELKKKNIELSGNVTTVDKAVTELSRVLEVSDNA